MIFIFHVFTAILWAYFCNNYFQFPKNFHLTNTQKKFSLFNSLFYRIIKSHLFFRNFSQFKKKSHFFNMLEIKVHIVGPPCLLYFCAYK